MLVCVYRSLNKEEYVAFTQNWERHLLIRVAQASPAQVHLGQSIACLSAPREVGTILNTRIIKGSSIGEGQRSSRGCRLAVYRVDEFQIHAYKYEDAKQSLAVATGRRSQQEVLYEIAIFFQGSRPKGVETIAAFVLNGFSAQYGRVLELVRAAVGRPEQPVLSLSYVTTSIEVLKQSHIDEHMPWLDFAVSYKLDGLHCVLVLQNGIANLITEKTVKQFQYSLPRNQKDLFIVEGELMNQRIMLYDAIVIGDRDLTGEPYRERLNALQQLSVIECGDYQIKPLQKQFVSTPTEFIRIAQEQLALAQSSGDPCDGLILQQNGDYRRNLILKWKPADQCTVDFYIKKTRSSNGQAEGRLYIGASSLVLRHFKQCGLSSDQVITHNGLAHIPFIPSVRSCDPRSQDAINLFNISASQLTQLDGQIGEFLFKNGAWHLQRLREDKIRANSYITAESVYTQLMHPIELADLVRRPQQYFAKEPSEQFKNMRKYMNRVKQLVISRVAGHRRILDLGIGKGQDLPKYCQAGVADLTGVDSDMKALQEVVDRKLSFIYDGLCDGDSRCSVPIVRLFNCDLTSPQVKNICKLITDERVPIPQIVVAMFSFHYFWRNPLIYELLSLVEDKGLVLISVIDSKQVKALLQNASHYKRGIYEYGVKGDVLNIKLPFSDQLMSEQLVDTEQLSVWMSGAGFHLLQEFNFASPHLRTYKAIKEARAVCDADDLAHAGLYTFLIYKKTTQRL